jgi:hypothetical protein
MPEFLTDGTGLQRHKQFIHILGVKWKIDPITRQVVLVESPICSAQEQPAA